MKKILSVVLLLVLLFALAACGSSKTHTVIMENVSEAELLRLYGMAVSAEYPEGEAVPVSQIMDSPYNPVVQILEKKEDPNDPTKYVYTVEVDYFLRVGFRDYVVTKEEYENILAWQTTSGKQVIFPYVETREIDNDADLWYKVIKEEGGFVPVDANGNRITYSDDAVLVENYGRDRDGNIRYYREMPDNAFWIRVYLYHYYQFRYGCEPTYPLETSDSFYVEYYKGK